MKRLNAKDRTTPTYLPNYKEGLLELKIGESLRVRGFEDADDLRYFAGHYLTIIAGMTESKYSHEINESNLTYTARRLI